MAWPVRIGVLLAAIAGCRGSGGAPEPDVGVASLRGGTVLVLPVQYVDRIDGVWIGGASGEREAARQADAEIEFALSERGGRVRWIAPDQQVTTLRRRPSIEVDPYTLSAEEVRREGSGLRRIRDPLYGEIRALAALFDARYAVWPVEITYAAGSGGRAGIRTLLLDARGGDVLWQDVVYGAPAPAGAPAALASAAQRFAERVTP